MPFDTTQASYQQFRNVYTERTRQVVAWVGAGLSVPAGLPTWPQLRRKLEETGLSKAKTMDDAACQTLTSHIQASTSIPNPWTAFEVLAEALGPTTYPTAIKQALTAADNAPVDAYLRLWRLKHLTGLLNLNLDRLATKALNITRPGVLPNECAGLEVGERIEMLKSSKPFIVNLHGTVDDSRSWVLTKLNLATLLANDSYRSFIDTVFSSRTVLFVGLSADDVAAGGLLSNLRLKGVNSGPHYWITSRRDSATDTWAEANGILVIRYTNASGSHAELSEIFDDLTKFVPNEQAAPPVVGSMTTVAAPLPSPEELASQTPESIRKILNAHASRVLQSGDDQAMAEYEKLCETYRRAIHNAWYVSSEPPDNQLFGYSLEAEIGRGAFGRVYRARGEDGFQVAIKLLLGEVRENADMLGSFRRGVRSMKILSQREVTGMVPYITAFELPPCAVMELVDGMGLDTVIKARLLPEWHDKLKVALDIAKIIRKGHALPERVLHRDVRPQNVMIRRSKDGLVNGDVVVLDFDLSWHKGALEKSVEVNAVAALGYLAPEQGRLIKGVSTRNAAVDSFGMGMTLFYMFAGRHPLPSEAESSDWSQTVMGALVSQGCSGGASIPVRVARLILAATAANQSARVDMGSIEAELARLLLALDDWCKVESAELWAEEALSTCFGPGEYEWVSDESCGQCTLPNGLVVKVTGLEAKGRIDLSIDWTSAGDQHYNKVQKYVAAASEQIRAILGKSKWDIRHKQAGQGALFLDASIKVSALQHSRKGPFDALRKAVAVTKGE